MTIDRQRSAALLVGTSTSIDPDGAPLPAVEHNVTGLSRVLRDSKHGLFGRVEPLLNPYNSEVVRGHLKGLAATVSETLLVYYSGHAFAEDDDLYLAVQTTSLDERSLVRSSALSMKDVFRRLRGCRAENIAIILDCCRGGAGSRGLLESLGHGLDSVGGVFLLAASSRDEAALVRRGSRYTQMTSTIIEIGEKGLPAAGRSISLADVYDECSAAAEREGWPLPVALSTNSGHRLAVFLNQDQNQDEPFPSPRPQATEPSGGHAAAALRSDTVPDGRAVADPSPDVVVAEPDTGRADTPSVNPAEPSREQTGGGPSVRRSTGVDPVPTGTQPPRHVMESRILATFDRVGERFSGTAAILASLSLIAVVIAGGSISFLADVRTVPLKKSSGSTLSGLKEDEDLTVPARGQVVLPLVVEAAPGTLRFYPGEFFLLSRRGDGCGRADLAWSLTVDGRSVGAGRAALDSTADPPRSRADLNPSPGGLSGRSFDSPKEVAVTVNRRDDADCTARVSWSGAGFEPPGATWWRPMNRPIIVIGGGLAILSLIVASVFGLAGRAVTKLRKLTVAQVEESASADLQTL